MHSKHQMTVGLKKKKKKSFTLTPCTNLHDVLATCACLRQTKIEVCSSWSVHIFTAPPSQQLPLKRVLYLRWQQWSHSPGLIYLRDRIMNSLWHLIWPSLLIWVSAGIWTLIRAAHASRRSRCACTDFSAISCKLITCSHIPSGTLAKPQISQFYLKICLMHLVWGSLPSFFFFFWKQQPTQDQLLKPISDRQRHNLHLTESG